ncbi:helix-turn-helix domain-containing protein [Elizabethkingia anophelis]|uniref:helix-turn-helix domain-containing protein n=1 Tax=Elizabethkingia anophelis TaxID=1117645 RepID=UPI003786F941
MIDKSVPKKEIRYYKSISDLCKALGVPKPAHPLIVLINHDEISSNEVRYLVHDFYMISYKSNLNGKLKYGQGYYDFDEGGLIFVAPNQALSVIDEDECRGRSLFIHPDFFVGHPLFKSITKYGFFGYNINEALHLSEKEKDKIIHVFEDIKDELETSIDDTSQELVISYIEVLLNYSNRYYKRQFITRKVVNSPVIERFEDLLNSYYVTGSALENGIPSVKYFSDQLNVSSGYLSDLLRNLTGLNTQQHIHAKLIEVAKQKLSTSELTAAEIAYELGFEYPQSFNKLFKNKTGMTPLEFREHLN